MNQKLSNILQSWPFLLGLILGIYFIVLNVTGLDLKYIPGDLGDGRFNIYILEHAHQYFTGKIESYWNATFMYPEPEIITFSDNLLGSAPVYSFFRICGANIFSAFQLWFIVMAILNYSGCYLFLNWLLKNKYAAVLGAFVFAFSMGLQSQIAHAQTFPRFYIPLAIWMTLLFMNSLKPIHFFLAIFFTVMQFYNGIYLGFMLTIPLLFLFFIIVFKKRTEIFNHIKNWKWISKIAVSLGVNGLLLAYLMVPYYNRSLESGENVFENVLHTVPLFKSYIYAQPGSLIWNFLRGVGVELQASWDHQLFTGGITLLSFLIFIALVLLRKKWNLKSIITNQVLFIGIAGFLTFLFVIRIEDFTLYRYLFNVPGFASMRAMTRIINVEILFFGIGVGVVSLVVLKKYKNAAPILFVFLISLLTIDNYYEEGSSYRIEKKIAKQRLQELKYKMKDIPQGSIVSYETESRDFPVYCYQIDAMLAAQSLGLKTVNGYSGNSPGAYQGFWHDMNEQARISWFESKGFKPKKVYVIH